ncbi:hypothetical protein [Aeromonas salmonicida]|uniref:hypothetical protein n=1 Tax=Aeromonas salmonicida TaxID=645 RepID=UPI00131F5BD2|nr:hypothetical protein [Aeromonas salmonicida]QHE49915.1 hypothetical protein GO994_22665 [Aeromonas salmonicida subsp. salmonicida]QJF57913.1 hypothetical protein GO993_22825 [Aeromonas salmonicida subsp. salmonicida]
MKRFTHDADLRGMVVLRSLGFQLVPFKLHRFRKQRRLALMSFGKSSRNLHSPKNAWALLGATSHPRICCCHLIPTVYRVQPLNDVIHFLLA